MNRKQRREQPDPERPLSSRTIAVAAVLVLIFAVATATFLYEHESVEPQVDALSPSVVLASEHAPTMGDPDARVHIVEFLDPACGTCAAFYPLVKQWLNEAPDKLRLSVRHVAFHTGAEYAVRVLEASREQDKYWETLETLLATQQRWVRNHVVLQDQVLPAIAGVGLDTDRLMLDMATDEVTQRIERDQQAAIDLRVRATPEYYVNGRGLTRFGQQQLLDLVREELGKNYNQAGP